MDARLPLLEIMRPAPKLSIASRVCQIERFPLWISEDKQDWIISAAADWRVEHPYAAKMTAYLREHDWLETESGWKHPDTGEEEYSLNQAYAYEHEQRDEAEAA